MPTRELILELLGRDKVSPAFSSAGRAAGRLDDDIDDLGRGLTKLDAEIMVTEVELGKLARAFAEADNAAERMDLSKSMRNLEAGIRQSSKARLHLRNLIDLEPGDSGGRSIGKKLVEAIASGASSVSSLAGNKIGMTIGVATGAAAAPVLISTLGSALSVGLGGAGIGAGVAAAVANDPELQRAGQRVGQKFSTSVQKEAAEAFRGPVLESLGTLERSGGRVAARLGTMFDRLAPSLNPLVSKISFASEALVDDLAGAAEQSGPAVDALGDSVVVLGDALGDTVASIADGGPEAAANLRMIAGGIGDLVRAQGGAIKGMSAMANNPWITGPILPLLRKHYDEAGRAAGDMAVNQQALLPGMTNLAAAAEAADMKVKGLVETLNESVDSNLSAYEAETRAASAIRTATAAIEKNGKSTAANTEKGQKNRETLSELAGAFNRVTTANDKAGVAAGVANRKFDSQRAAFIRAAVAAGYTAGQANNLANKILKIPTSRTINIRAITGGAQAKIQAIKDSLARVPGSKTITIRTVADIPAGMSMGQLMREKGGPVRKGEAYVVGERRPEVFVPNSDGTIIPSINQFHGGGGTGGGAGVVVNVHAGWIASPQQLEDKMTKVFDDLRRKGRI